MRYSKLTWASLTTCFVLLVVDSILERGQRACPEEVGFACFGLSCALAGEKATQVADESADWLAQLRSAREQATNAAKLREAWEKLVRRGPRILPKILEAMDTPNTVAANWLHTAFDRIAEPALKNGGKGIDVDALLVFAADVKRQGWARRLALETADRVRPSSGTRLMRKWIDDPEFGYDAIDYNLAELAKAKDLPKEKAVAALGRLIAATTDISQARAVAGKMKELGVHVSLADTFGFPREWLLLGPFEGGGRKSFHTVYPPETKVDLKAEYGGKAGKTIRWKRVSVPEAVAGSYPVMIDLRKPLGEVEDAVGFAYTLLELPTEREVEFRAAADDNLAVWVNGERVFAFEEWTNGMRLDRHRFKVGLKAGANTVLVKVCQGKGDPGTPDGNWEFVLRLCDAVGRGVSFKASLPVEK